MAAFNRDLHGNAPDKSSDALLLIDVINDLEFPGSAALVKCATTMAHRLADLKARAKKAGVPVIYVNDNFGRWQSDFKRQVQHCLHDGVPGQAVAELLRPGEDDYFVLKPKHSGFYSTNLDILLKYLEARRLVITGIASNICVLFTANDAYMRDFAVTVPRDCACANTPAIHRAALAQMKSILKADIRPSTSLRFRKTRRSQR